MAIASSVLVSHETQALQGKDGSMRRIPVTVLLCLVSVASYAEKPRESDWQTGTLREISQSTHSGVVGVVNDGHGFVGERMSAVMHYFVDSPEYTYEANMLLKGRHPKQLLVTIHGPIKFALIGHDFYVQDDEGKTQKLVFIMREVRR